MSQDFNDVRGYYSVRDASSFTTALKRSRLNLPYNTKTPLDSNNTRDTYIPGDYQASQIAPHISTFASIQARAKLFSPSGGIRR
jgi:hypothetical protein